jgi:hydrogenase maturation protease
LTGKGPKILVYGYGNPGRQDDGLGVMLSMELERWAEVNGLPVQTDSNYQLNPEDAAGIANYDLVIFADASKESISDFIFEPLAISDKVEFGMHSFSPAYVLNLCKMIFHYEPETYLLHIRGYEWNFMGKMTGAARNNLNVAIAYLETFIYEYLNKKLVQHSS